MMMCSIAYLDTSAASAGALIAEFATAEDRSDAARHSRPSRRRQTLAVRALLRAALAREITLPPGASWRLVRSAQGHPSEAVAAATRRVLSLAHSGAIVACATAPAGMVGIDVERITSERSVLDLARAAFGPSEINDVEREGATSFYRIWTLREALAKASGKGFDLLVNGRDLVPGVGRIARRRIEGLNWDLRSWTLREGYALSFAREASDTSPIVLPLNITDDPQPGRRPRRAPSD